MLTAAPGTMETPTLPARSKDEIAVVVPVYMGKAVLRKLCGRLVAALEPITPHFSIVLVDDRSPDDAWPLIQELGREDRRIRGVQLSRNFGQHYALTAGIDHARAHWYVVMDCDLQDAPEDIPLLYATAPGSSTVSSTSSRASTSTGAWATSASSPTASPRGSGRCVSRCGFSPRA